MSVKNFNDDTRNRTRDLPGCSTVPQPTATPRGNNICWMSDELMGEGNKIDVYFVQNNSVSLTEKPSYLGSFPDSA
jgi:hypothetical protein